MSLSAHPSHPTCRVSRCARVRSSKLKLPTRPVHGAPYSARPNHAMLCNISWHGPPKNAVTAATHRHPFRGEAPVRQFPGCRRRPLSTTMAYPAATARIGLNQLKFRATLTGKVAKLEPPSNSCKPGLRTLSFVRRATRNPFGSLLCHCHMAQSTTRHATGPPAVWACKRATCVRQLEGSPSHLRMRALGYVRRPVSCLC